MTNRNHFPGTLWNVGWRYLLRHPWQTILMVVGIMLGVAVVISIDLANTSASRAFDLSVESIAGRATHQISGPPGGFSDAVYTDLRRTGVNVATAPIITEYVTSDALGGQTLQLLGVDPFAETPFRDYLASDEGVPVAQLAVFFSQPGALLISSDLADTYDLAQGDGIMLMVGGRDQPAFIAGVLEPRDRLSRRALNGLILADISTAQELTGRIGRLDRVDLLIPESDIASIDQIDVMLPADLRISEVSARSGAVEQMTSAFRTNLLALSLLALVVGMFLIYNTMTFSVVQRRALFGTLRCLGVTRREVFIMVVGEAALVGLIGSLLGAALGIAMGQGAVNAVTRTINDLFFVLTVKGVAIPVESVLKGLGLGVVMTVATAAMPALEAASVPPRAALSRSGLESKADQVVIWVSVAGLALFLLGGGVLMLPIPDLTVSFLATFLVIVGLAMLTPMAMRIFLAAAAPLMGRFIGLLGRMAPRDIIGSISRTSIAVAALMVAVSVTIGINVMVNSFRHTVVIWLEQTLVGDVYLNVPGGTQVSPSGLIDPAVLTLVSDWPGVEAVDTVRAVEVESPDGPVHVVAINAPNTGTDRLFLEQQGSPDALWDRMERGEAVTVSEPFARNRDVFSGDTLTLYTNDGPHTFEVVGVYYDYGRVSGSITMPQSVYRDLWDDPSITAVSLDLADGIDPDMVAEELQIELAPVQDLLIRPNRALREDVLVIFDQTFAITGALNLLATVVAFVGVLSTLLSLQLEKGRQLGILRAIGLTTAQVRGLVMLETGLMGLIAGVLSMPTGYVLSLILVYIINRRSFGWTLQMQVIPAPFLQALAVAVVAALLAGIYPAIRMGRMVTANAIRFE